MNTTCCHFSKKIYISYNLCLEHIIYIVIIDKNVSNFIYKKEEVIRTNFQLDWNLFKIFDDVITWVTSGPAFSFSSGKICVPTPLKFCFVLPHPFEKANSPHPLP